MACACTWLNFWGRGLPISNASRSHLRPGAEWFLHPRRCRGGMSCVVAHVRAVILHERRGVMDRHADQGAFPRAWLR
jgi:hypothetical protein